MFIKKTKIPLAHVALYAWMPSFLKIWVYRAKGYKIGARAKIGIGSVVVGHEIEIGPEARIAPLTAITGDSVKIGPRVRIGALTVMNTKTIEIGEGTRINNMVVVGGLQSVRSAFRMGHNCILMEWSFVNTTEPVVIGNNVGIGGHCLFFTHGLWPNTFKGYPSKFGSITIEDDAWLAWRVSVLPEVVVGQGCIISSDACVTKSFEAGNLIAGIPAKAIKGDFFYKKEMTDESRTALMETVLEEYLDAVRLGGTSINMTKSEGQTDVVLGSDAHSGLKISFYDTVLERLPELPKSGCVVLLNSASQDAFAHLDAKGIPWLDVANTRRSHHSSELSEEYENFLRQAGLRFLQYT